MFIQPVFAQKNRVDELERSYQGLIKKGYKSYAAKARMQQGDISLANGEADKALKYYQESIQIYHGIDSKLKKAITLKKLSNAYISLGVYDKARDALDEALTIYTSLKKVREAYWTRFDIGRVDYLEGDFEGARNTLLEVLGYSYDYEDKKLEIEVCLLLSDVYEAIGEQETALAYYKHASAQEEILNVKEINSLQSNLKKESASLKAKEKLISEKEKALESIVMEKKEAEELARLRQVEINALENDRALKELLIQQKEEKLKQDALIMKITWIGVLIFLLFLIILMNDLVKRKKLIKKLAVKNEEVENKSDLLLKKNEELKSRQEEILSQQDALRKSRNSLAEANKQNLAQKAEIAEAYNNVKQISLIGQSITASLDKKEVIHKIVDHLRKILEIDIFLLGSYEIKERKILFEGVYDQQDIDSYHQDLKDKIHPVSLTFNESFPVLVKDIKNSKYSHDFDFCQAVDQKANSAIFLPLTYDFEPIGVVSIQSFKANAYDTHQLNFMQALASYISIALLNIKAYDELAVAIQTINSKNRSITDSIRYANKIQGVILPEKKMLDTFFDGSFTLYQPKDIVSGDFYWCEYDEDEVFHLVLADCTGHGVPGAFMSMIGSILLDRAVTKEKGSTPSKILQNLHEFVKIALKQNDGTNDDGMDVCYCTFKKINDQQFKLTYSGAKRPLYVIQKGELLEIKGDRKSIGGKQRKNELLPFTDREIILNRGDQVYLTTDGYADQLSRDMQRYGSAKLKNRLCQIAELTIEEQYEVLKQEYEGYLEDSSQKDDISIIGVRL